MESADITLLKGDLLGILRAKKLSEATMKNIRQNLFFAFIYNLVGVPVAGWRSLSDFRLAFKPDDCKRGNDFQFRVGYCQRAAFEKFEIVGEKKN
jgi:hypothetical protein